MMITNRELQLQQEALLSELYQHTLDLYSCLIDYSNGLCMNDWIKIKEQIIWERHQWIQDNFKTKLIKNND